MPRSVTFKYREPFDIQRFHREICIILHNEAIYINDATIAITSDIQGFNIEIYMKYDKRQY